MCSPNCALQIIDIYFTLLCFLSPRLHTSFSPFLLFLVKSAASTISKLLAKLKKHSVQTPDGFLPYLNCQRKRTRLRLCCLVSTYLKRAMSTMTLLIQSTHDPTTESRESIVENCHRRRPNWRSLTDICWLLWTSQLSRFCAPCNITSRLEMRCHSSRL